MEQEIKNFDRAIERIMDQQQVTPPFSMWNRISAELDATSTPAPAPSNSMMPKRAMYGILAAAMLGVSMVGAYLLSTSPKTDVRAISKSTPSVNEQPATVERAVTSQPLAAVIAPQHKVAKTSKHVVARIQPQNVVVGAVDPKPAQSMGNTAAAVSTENKVSPVGFTVIANNDVPVPVNEVDAKALNQNESYYFPPVDNITPSKSSTQSALNTGKTEEKKIDVPVPAVKTKFHPHKHRGFGYGKINRNK